MLKLSIIVLVSNDCDSISVKFMIVLKEFVVNVLGKPDRSFSILIDSYENTHILQ